MARAMGMLEAFGLAEEVGARALSLDEVLFMAEAKKRKGCKLQSSTLTPEEIQRVLDLGRKCRAWKKG